MTVEPKDQINKQLSSTGQSGDQILENEGAIFEQQAIQHPQNRDEQGNEDVGQGHVGRVFQLHHSLQVSDGSPEAQPQEKRRHDASPHPRFLCSQRLNQLPCRQIKPQK